MNLPNRFYNIIAFCLGLAVLSGCEKPKSADSAKKASSAALGKEAPAVKSAPLSEKERQAREYQELKDKYAGLEKDYNNLSLDRDNLINQAKSLLGNRSRAQELEGLLAESKKEKEILEKDANELVSKSISWEEKYKKQESEIGRLQNELKRSEDLLAKERDKSQLKKMEQEKARLLKELNDVKYSLNQVRAELSRYKDLNSKAQGNLEAKDKGMEAKDKGLAAKAEELEKLRVKVESLNKSYSEAVRKNRQLEQRVLTTPGKFAELARQNKTLIKQTANMHYNLGVFYTKNKEYTRAVAEFEKALELRPDDDYAHFNIGYIYAEYLVNRPKAVEHFRHFLRLTKSSDKDVDWVKKYILTWQSWAGKEPME